MRQVNLDSSADLSENSFNHNNLPSIFAFPKDGNSWRIDWFGDIAFPNRLLRRTQPSVLVHLSRVLDTSFDENPTALLSADSTFVSKQRKVWISVGTLPLLSIGDVWRDGQLEMRPDYESECFSDLEINPETAVLIKAGLNLEERGFILPLSEHPWHMQCTQSYCLMVELPHNRRLIIPCMELIRFYFGSSSNLLTKLFLPPLSRDALYSKPHFDRATGRLTLQLAASISGVSAADIGRLHMDPVAWRAAAHVGASLLKSSVTGQGAYPQAYFPFEGKTSLIATGKWLPLGEEPRATFIAYSLRSCSHQFPFRSLRYDVKDRRSPSATSKYVTPNGSPGRDFRKPARNSPDQQLVESDASSKLASQAKPMWNAARFPDLAAKTIWKNRILSAPTDDVAFAGASAIGVQYVAVGEAGSERRVRSIDLQLRSRRDCMGKDYEETDNVDVFIESHKVVFPLLVKALKQGGSLCWQVGFHAKDGLVTPLDYLVYDCLRAFPDMKLRNRIVWTFGHGLHCSNRFSGRHETVLWFTKGDAYRFDLDAVRVEQKYPGKRHASGPKKGQLSGNPLGKNPGDVWEIPNVKANHIEKTEHPCQFPVGIVHRLVRALTKPGDLVLDPFCGVSSTGVAALALERRFLGAEIMEEYVMIGQERLKEAAKGEAEFRPAEKDIYVPDPNSSVARRPEASEWIAQSSSASNNAI